MTALATLIGYQIVWFGAVIGAAHGRAWPAVVCTLAFGVWQLMISRQRAIDLGLVLVALLLGACLDGLLAVSGWITYSTPMPALPGGAPLWILMLWIAFALTFNHTLTFLRGRPFFAACIGVVGAPLAYAGAARGWQAVAFAPPAWRGLVALALGWAVAMAIMAMLAQRWTFKPSIDARSMPEIPV